MKPPNKSIWKFCTFSGQLFASPLGVQFSVHDAKGFIIWFVGWTFWEFFYHSLMPRNLLLLGNLWFDDLCAEWLGDRLKFVFSRGSWLVSWCFEPSQPQWITSGLSTNFILSPGYSFRKSSFHKSCYCCCFLFLFFCVFFSLFISRGHSTREPAFGRVTYFILRERFWKKCRWMDWKGRNKKGRNLWQ